jgi:hypothetical protein
MHNFRTVQGPESKSQYKKKKERKEKNTSGVLGIFLFVCLTAEDKLKQMGPCRTWIQTGPLWRTSLVAKHHGYLLYNLHNELQNRYL